jgi:hypothetical protein
VLSLICNQCSAEVNYFIYVFVIIFLQHRLKGVMPFDVKAPIQISDGTAYNKVVEQVFHKMEQGVPKCGTSLKMASAVF